MSDVNCGETVWRFPLTPFLHFPLTPFLPPFLQAKKAIKEVPKDDEEVERQEEGEIDRGFTESSSSSEDELTEAGQYGRELMTPLHMCMYCWTFYLLLPPTTCDCIQMKGCCCYSLPLSWNKYYHVLYSCIVL